MPIVKFKNVVAETLDASPNPKSRVWHVRRPGQPMQPTLCGLLFARKGETTTLGSIGAEYICPRCLNRMEVVR